jgi:GNAT superfamily N-acetyltransferase
MSTPAANRRSDVSVRPMAEADLSEAARIFRIAFGTFIGIPQPESFAADHDYIGTRWRANPPAALVAEVDGALAGSNLATNWGSFGFFGPLTVRPDLWGQGIAQSLLVSTMELFEVWRVREAGLFTFAHSAKHVGLYQKFGFWPRFLTAVMARSVEARPALLNDWVNYSALDKTGRFESLSECRSLTDAIFEGLDATSEIRAVSEQNLGETVLLQGTDRLDAFAVCHCGEGTEAGSGNCYIKFAAVRPGAGAEAAFDRLLDACEVLAAGRGLIRVEAGVNLARSGAYRQMLRRGYRTAIQGVAMLRDDLPGFNRPDVYIVDDWR